MGLGDFSGTAPPWICQFLETVNKEPVNVPFVGESIGPEPATWPPLSSGSHTQGHYFLALNTSETGTRKLESLGPLKFLQTNQS